MRAEDLQIDTYRAGVGAGFASSVHAAVRVTHRPTGLVSTAEGRGSMLKLREQAIVELERMVDMHDK